jgi:hypothetical protein
MILRPEWRVFVSKALFLFAGLLVATSVPAVCGDEPKKDAPPPKPPAFEVPKGWQEVEAGPLVSARFQIKEKDRLATVQVLALPGDGGGLAANVNRWRAQVGLDALAEKDALKSLTSVKVDGIAGHSLDLTGSDAPDKATMRIRVVIVTSGDQTWYFKLMGPASLVADQVSAFDGFIKSVRFGK